MLINVEWLRDFVTVEGGVDRLADDLTTAGLEVDAVTSARPDFAGVVVARILERQPHPKADRLAVCTVDDGAEPRTVVCGAPNAAAGLRVAYAPAGARLPGGRGIETADVRGVASAGMLCSGRELGLSDDGAGLLVLDDDAPVGVPLDDYLRLDDAVLDVNLTANRGDCFSVLGIAREVAALRRVPLRSADSATVAAETARDFPVVLPAAHACPRFAGRVVEGIRTGVSSPDWLKERLRRAGLRAIHPVVDVTNYVMLELGQPLHAYSLDELDRGIAVRLAAKNERLTLLDGKELVLEPDVLVIADAAGAVGLAGIMGGARTAVTAGTQRVFLESAFFSPAAIQGRARRYGLHTDASVRFERGVDPTQQERAVERATELLVSIAGGRAGPTRVAEVPAELPEREPIDLRAERIEAVLGMRVDGNDVENLLERLGMRTERHADGWLVVPPPFRFDVSLDIDLIEEIARLTGYDDIPAIPGRGSAVLGTASEAFVGEDAIADTLVARGYLEAVCYTFVDAGAQEAVNAGAEHVTLENPISAELGVMRRSLWPGLLRAAQSNLTRQQSRLRLFEIGTRFAPGAGGGIEESRAVAGLAAGDLWPEHWDVERRPVDFFDIKSDVESLLGMTGRAGEVVFRPDAHPALNPSRSARICRADGETLGWLGELHPRVQKYFEIKPAVVLFTLQIENAFGARITSYSRLSKFPFVRRDLAVVVGDDITAADIVAQVQNAAGALLQDVRVFDVYRGQGIDSSRKSIGLGLILQDVSRTLTDEDADRTVDAVMRRLEHALGATIRT